MNRPAERCTHIRGGGRTLLWNREIDQPQYNRPAYQGQGQTDGKSGETRAGPAHRKRLIVGAGIAVREKEAMMAACRRAPMVGK